MQSKGLSLLQHHSSKASILQCSAFFTVQLSHPYMTTGKTIALTRRPFVGKVMSLLLNMLSRLVITFLPRSKRLLISNDLKRYNRQCLSRSFAIYHLSLSLKLNKSSLLGIPYYFFDNLRSVDCIDDIFFHDFFSIVMTKSKFKPA